MTHSGMDEAAMVARANEEREKLYQRYDRGREVGADIDPWEDPGFEVYHQTDRYGFIHDKRLPQKTDLNEAKAKQIEMERVKKWLKMTAKWEDRKTREVLEKRVFKGIPDKMRSRVWVKLMNVEQTMDANRDVYQKMLKLARQWSTEARQIDSDVNRQFREHLFYRERYNIKQKSLFNILTAYSMYNSEVGYCQGMSGVAGVLLMYMNEEEAFWALSTILTDKRYAMHGLYIEGFPKLNRFLAHHDVIMSNLLPKLKKHFDQYNLDSILYSLKWFFVIFIERIPFSLCLRVWDIYLLDGERVVTAMAYTILRIHKKQLLKLKDMDLIVEYIQTKLHKNFGYDDDYVIKMLEQSMDELRKAKLDLPPPAQPNEFPQKPFGVFVEPNFEAKVGIRKSIFSDTEKEVTDKVILRREMTVQELADIQAAESGSIGQLNASGYVPESEDGGSLLGSSRKSLADTSVTSTADLSVFSTGQRSHQAFDICVDDARSVRTDDDDPDDAENGDLSPGSAFCSLSIVGRTPSAMMITPTPRAMSPQDIVRIYVPPAPPEESPTSITPTINQHHHHHQQPQQRRNLSASNQSLSSSTTTTTTSAAPPLVNRPSSQLNGSRDHLYHNNHTHRRSIVSPTPSTTIAATKSNTNSVVENGDATPRRRSLHRSEEELNSLMLQMYSQFDPSKSTSSSRRGSLSRKSPSSSLMLHDEHNRLMMECSHIPAASGQRRRSSSEQLANSFTISTENVTTASSLLRHTMSPERKVLMTSFEELAQKRDRMVKSDIMRSSQDSLSRGLRAAAFGVGGSSSQYVSESNIEYQPLRRTSLPKNGESVHVVHGAKDQVIDAYPTTVKPYSRYYTGNVNNGDEDDEDDEDDDYRNRSSGSSSSPNSKSVVSTPVNESVPPMAEKLRIEEYGDHSYSTQSNNTQRSRIPQIASPPSSYSRKSSFTSNSSQSSMSKTSKIPTLFQKASSPTDEPDFDEQPVSPRFHSTPTKRQRQQIPPLIDQRRQIPPPSSGSFADLDSRIAAPLGGVYQFTRNTNSIPKQQHHHHHQGSSAGSGGNGLMSASAGPTTTTTSSSTNRSIESGLRKPTDMNKIRIKINQNQRN